MKKIAGPVDIYKCPICGYIITISIHAKPPVCPTCMGKGSDPIYKKNVPLV